MMNNEWRDIIRRHSRPLQPPLTALQPVLRPLSGIKAALFDIYGTLLISGSGDVRTSPAQKPSFFKKPGFSCRMESRGDAFTEALAAVNIRYNGPCAEGEARLMAGIEEFHAASRKNGIEHPEVDIVAVWRNTLASLTTAGLIDPTGIVGQTFQSADRLESLPHIFDDSRLKRLAVEYEVRTNPVWPMPHCADCLRRLREAGLRLGIISNAQFFTPEFFPTLLGADLDELGFLCELRFYSYLSGQAKPGVFLHELARDALLRFDISPAQALYVGNDMLNDVFPANLTGFRTALFAGDERSLRLRTDDPRVTRLVPDLVLTDLAQLPGCLLPGEFAD